MQITVLLAFGYGFLSFFSPCILPLLPVYIANLTSHEIFENREKRRRFVIFFHSLVFVIGFAIVFTLFGAGAGLVGAALSTHLELAKKIAGALIIAFGVLMLAALKIPWLNYEKRFTVKGLTAGSYFRSFIIGAAFPVAWIPCTSWALGGILLLAGTSQTAWQGAYLLAIYSLGLGLPFLIMGAAFDFVTPLLKNIRRYSVWIYVTSGLLLIVMGILVLTDKLGWLPGQI